MSNKYGTLNMGGSEIKKSRGKGFYALVTLAAVGGVGAIATAITLAVLYMKKKKSSSSASTSKSTSTSTQAAFAPVKQMPSGLKAIVPPVEEDEEVVSVVGFGSDEDDMGSF
jgi:hypothetical protein